MTKKEAINLIRYRIKTASEIIGNGEDGKAFEDLHMAIEALEKQIPKMVEVHAWNPAKCPSCGIELSESIGDGYYKHSTSLEVCPNVECCQRLKWE